MGCCNNEGQKACCSQDGAAKSASKLKSIPWFKLSLAALVVLVALNWQA